MSLICFGKKFITVSYIYIFIISKSLSLEMIIAWSIFVHFSPLSPYGTYQSISVHLVYFSLIQSNLIQFKWAWNLKPSLPILYSKKKPHAHIINCIYSLSQIYFFLFLYLCLFSTQLIILEVQSNWIRNGWSLKYLKTWVKYWHGPGLGCRLFFPCLVITFKHFPILLYMIRNVNEDP